jgi:hypothetical protein
MNTRIAEVGELGRPAAVASWKALTCATLALAITMATMLTIGDTAGTRLFVSAPSIAAPSGATAPLTLAQALR